jgi:3-hydroxybutyryl-CoA dehydrogenase
MEVKTIAVIGAGTMGNGIAQIAATAGLDVWLQKWKRNEQDDWLGRALKPIQGSLERVVKKGNMTEAEKDAVLSRIHVTHDLKEAVENADYIIESIPEMFDRKIEIFKELDKFAQKHAVLATNTSTFRITSIAVATTRQDKVIGTHFFNPPVMRRFVEVIRGFGTSDETLQLTNDLFHKWDMETIVCQKDSVGFVTSRLSVAFSNEAMRIHEEGLATADDIDKACRLAFGHPMGPLLVADATGLDTSLNARRSLFAVYGERFRPPQTLVNMVEAGHVGKKAGQGYYTYDKEKK